MASSKTTGFPSESAGPTGKRFAERGGGDTVDVDKRGPDGQRAFGSIAGSGLCGQTHKGRRLASREDRGEPHAGSDERSALCRIVGISFYLF